MRCVVPLGWQIPLNGRGRRRSGVENKHFWANSNENFLYALKEVLKGSNRHSVFWILMLFTQIFHLCTRSFPMGHEEVVVQTRFSWFYVEIIVSHLVKPNSIYPFMHLSLEGNFRPCVDWALWSVQHAQFPLDDYRPRVGRKELERQSFFISPKLAENNNF